MDESSRNYEIYQDLLNGIAKEKKFKKTTQIKPTILIKSYENEDTYLFPWTKLKKNQKINRILKYLSENNLTDIKLHDLLLNGINSRILTKKETVNYDSSLGKIINIPILSITSASTGCNKEYSLNISKDK